MKKLLTSSALSLALLTPATAEASWTDFRHEQNMEGLQVLRDWGELVFYATYKLHSQRMIDRERRRLCSAANGVMFSSGQIKSELTIVRKQCKQIYRSTRFDRAPDLPKHTRISGIWVRPWEKERSRKARVEKERAERARAAKVKARKEWARQKAAAKEKAAKEKAMNEKARFENYRGSITEDHERLAERAKLWREQQHESIQKAKEGK